MIQWQLKVKCPSQDKKRCLKIQMYEVDKKLPYLFLTKL